MSLVVWLPLTKDLRQQGLSNVTVTNSGATYESSGKLGGCYNLTNGPINITNLPNPTSISVAFWFKRTANTNTRQFMFTAWSGVTCELTTDGKPTFAVYRDSYPTITGPTAITTSTGWIHYCGTFSPTEGMKMYLNGELVASNTNTTAISWSTTTGQIGKYGSYASMSAQMDDFRIYDHALSQMEVKELAKGLILHYPLNRQGWGQENLFTEKYWSYGSGWNTKNIINSSTSTVKPIVNSDGSCTLTGGDAASSQCYCSNNGNMVTLEPNTTYTISVKITANGPCNFRMWWYDYNSSGTKLTTVSTPSEIIPSGTTKLFTFTRTTVANTASCYWELNLYGTPSTSTCVMHAKSLKLELGSIATPWCPNSSDTLATTMGLNSTTEYDCSGFCNNGTWHGTHTNTSDTSKYAVSTTATGSGTTYLEGPVLPAEAKTVALWIKNTSKSSNGAIFNDKTSGLQIGLLNSLLYMNSKASTAGFTTTHWVNGEWNHVVAINNDGTRSLYVNGQPETQSGASNYYIHNADNCWLWNRSYNNSYPFTGSLCDLRIYATALSASDVKSLYQNSAYIDSSGNVYGAVHTEV